MGSFQQPQPDKAAGSSPAKYRCVKPAASDEVMMEQLEFLLVNHGAGCPEPCPHCARLAKIRYHLLSPFRVARYDRGEKPPWRGRSG